MNKEEIDMTAKKYKEWIMWLVLNREPVECFYTINQLSVSTEAKIVIGFGLGVFSHHMSDLVVRMREQQ